MDFKANLSPQCRKRGQANRVAIFLGMTLGVLALLILYTIGGGKPFGPRDIVIVLSLLVCTVIIPGWLLLVDNSRRSR